MEFVELLTLQNQIREGLLDCFPRSLWVKAEVAQIQQRSNGHCYLDLAQSDESGLVAKVKAVIWKNRYPLLSRAFYDATGGPVRAGMTILALSQVNYSELYGLSLVIEDIEPQFTLGEAELEKRRTLGKLKADGLMDRQQELHPSALPYNLAVISAADAAGFGDFCTHLEENEYGFKFNVKLFPATMQGAAAPQSMIDALELVQSSATAYDAVLIMRGGGSALDLACFDDYGLCMAIAVCDIPVYTAIGHDRDTHIADMVAYRYVKTPTALADEFIETVAAEDAAISEFATRLTLAFRDRLAQMETALSLLESRISAADPRLILERGYSLVTDAQGRVVKSCARLGAGQKIYVLFKDGKIEAEVK